MRYDDWQDRFWAELEKLRTEPFVWGERDCALFAARMADAISDGQYVERIRELFTWKSEAEAAVLTVNGLQGLVEGLLGPMQPWPRLSMGDAVLIIDDQGREALSVHDGVQLIGPANKDIQVIPFRCARGGWMIR